MTKFYIVTQWTQLLPGFEPVTQWAYSEPYTTMLPSLFPSSYNLQLPVNVVFSSIKTKSKVLFSFLLIKRERREISFSLLCPIHLHYKKGREYGIILSLFLHFHVCLSEVFQQILNIHLIKKDLKKRLKY